MRGIGYALLALVACGGGFGCWTQPAWAQDALGIPVLLQEERFDSLYVIRVSAARKVAQYVAAMPELVGPDGTPLATLRAVYDGADLILGGSIEVRSNPSDVAALEREAAAAWGERISIREAPAVAYAMWAYLGDSLVWHRPAARGARASLEVRTPMDGAALDRAGPLRLVVQSAWQLRPRVTRLRLTFDWKSILAGLEIAARADSLNQAALDAFCRRALDEGWIRAEGDGAPEAYIPMAAEQVRMRLLEDGAPRPVPGSADARSYEVPYLLREDVAPESLEPVVELAGPQRLRQAAVRVRLIPLELKREVAASQDARAPVASAKPAPWATPLPPPPDLQAQAKYKTLAVVRSDSERRRVAYVPMVPTPVDASGKPVESFETIRAGDRLIITGRVSLLCDPAEVAALEKETREALGADASVKRVEPSSYGLWLLAGEEVVWHRPESGGSPERFPVQAMLDASKLEQDPQLRLVAEIHWRERPPSSGLTMAFDWETVVREMRKQFDGTSVIQRTALEAFSAKAVRENWVRPRGKGGSEQVGLLVAALIGQRLLKENANSAKAAPGATSYSLRERIEVRNLKAEIRVAQNFSIPRSATATKRVPVSLGKEGGT